MVIPVAVAVAGGEVDNPRSRRVKGWGCCVDASGLGRIGLAACFFGVI